MISYFMQKKNLFYEKMTLLSESAILGCWAMGFPPKLLIYLIKSFFS